tara:strand:+ start:375 stop:554 length:180 start_codon:yes stop_codon:yes gene_type:complete
MSKIQEKIEEVQAELQQVVDAHNKLSEQRNVVYQRFTELQGSLKTLKELQEVEDGGENS